MVLLPKATASIGHWFVCLRLDLLAQSGPCTWATTSWWWWCTTIISRFSPWFMCWSDLEKIHNRSLIQVAGEIIGFQYLVQLVCVFFFVGFGFFSFFFSFLFFLSMEFQCVSSMSAFGFCSWLYRSCNLDITWMSWWCCSSIAHSPLGDCAVGVWLLFDMVPGVNMSFVWA